MSDSDGISRLRKAADNQASLGEATFMLPIGEVLAMLDEIEDELARLAWAQGVPAPVDADGEAVPLTTKVMYTSSGKKIELTEFHLLHSVLSGGFVWRAIRDTDNGVNDLKLDFLHLRRPDSWELLEKDVSKAEDKGICGYFGFAMNRPCSAECPARDAHDSCAVTALHDVMRRAKALAERDAKEVDRD